MQVTNTTPIMEKLITIAPNAPKKNEEGKDDDVCQSLDFGNVGSKRNSKRTRDEDDPPLTPGMNNEEEWGGGEPKEDMEQELQSLEMQFDVLFQFIKTLACSYCERVEKTEKQVHTLYKVVAKLQKNLEVMSDELDLQSKNQDWMRDQLIQLRTAKKD